MDDPELLLSPAAADVLLRLEPVLLVTAVLAAPCLVPFVRAARDALRLGFFAPRLVGSLVRMFDEVGSVFLSLSRGSYGHLNLHVAPALPAPRG